jgi:hypothetical protein
VLEVNRQKAIRFANQVPIEITRSWLRDQCPLGADLEELAPSDVLSVLYDDGETVCVLTDSRSQGDLWRVGGSRPEDLDQLQEGQENVWFLVQPIDREFYRNPRSRSISRRSEESVTAWRYAVLESDAIEPEIWLKILVQLPPPISAIYTSGGKSIHALIRVDADSKAHWDQMARHPRFLRRLAELGVDPRTVTAVRLSRLPQCMRGETGKRQELLYINPDAIECQPLWH